MGRSFSSKGINTKRYSRSSIFSRRLIWYEEKLTHVLKSANSSTVEYLILLSSTYETKLLGEVHYFGSWDSLRDFRAQRRVKVCRSCNLVSVLISKQSLRHFILSYMSAENISIWQ